MIGSFQGEYRFLSNFHPSPVAMGDKVWPTVEHAYQASKTLDTGLRETIRMAATPGQAKRLGRILTLRRDWEAVKDGIMLDLLREKFRSEPLKTALLRTHPHILMEGNTWNDTYWGVCRGVGKNMLGTLLMQVRDELQ